MLDRLEKLKTLKKNPEAIKYITLEGKQGAPGLQGDRGATGPAGVQGARGYEGQPGIPGAKGEQGIPGPQGLRGIDGKSIVDSIEAGQNIVIDKRDPRHPFIGTDFKLTISDHQPDNPRINDLWIDTG